MGLFGEIDDGDGEISLDTWIFYIVFFLVHLFCPKKNSHFFSWESGSCGFFSVVGSWVKNYSDELNEKMIFFDEFLPGKQWKANMFPENQWLKDVFPIEIVPLFRGHVSFFGGVVGMNYKLETFEADVFWSLAGIKMLLPSHIWYRYR